MASASASLFNYENLVHAISGAAGGTVAMSVMYPLDIVKFRKQLDDGSISQKSALEALYYILKKEGVSSLYAGVQPSLACYSVSSFIYFYAFNGLKSLPYTLRSSAETDFLNSVIAGIINVLSTNPIWVVNSRLKVSNNTEDLHYTGLLDGVVHVANSEGIKALWSSVGPSLMLVSNPAINFTIYEALKRRVQTKSAFGYFLMAAVSKAIATVVTYPLQVAQTRKRYTRDTSLGTAALLLDIVKKNGFRGLYQGMETKLIETVLCAALMFMTYEKIAQFVFAILMKHRKR